MDRDEITAEVAARLVAGQFPQWAGLPVVPVGLGGWDNITFRLGRELSVRLPSGPDYAAQVAKEHRWLPVLAGQLPLPVPEPVALGQPAAGFPWPWSVYRWIEGEPAGLGQVTDLTEFAADLARFLASLYAIDASGGPPPGRHNWFRGGSLSTWDEQTRTCIDRLAADIDARAARQVWDSALASPWRQPPVWVHGDITASNLLLADGALHAVIDFGCTAVGDPACDLVMAWTFFPAGAAAAFRRGLPADEATWARARGWALWKALITLGGDDGGRAAARQFGWRYSPHQVIHRIIADHAQAIHKIVRVLPASCPLGGETSGPTAGPGTLRTGAQADDGEQSFRRPRRRLEASGTGGGTGTGTSPLVCGDARWFGGLPAESRSAARVRHLAFPGRRAAVS